MAENPPPEFPTCVLFERVSTDNTSAGIYGAQPTDAQYKALCACKLYIDHAKHECQYFCTHDEIRDWFLGSTSPSANAPPSASVCIDAISECSAAFTTSADLQSALGALLHRFVTDADNAAECARLIDDATEGAASVRIRAIEPAGSAHAFRVAVLDATFEGSRISVKRIGVRFRIMQ